MLPNTKFKISGRAISDFKDSEKCQCNFDLGDRGDISNYLGINFSKTKYVNLKLTQPHLIGHIIAEFILDIPIIIQSNIP